MAWRRPRAWPCVRHPQVRWREGAHAARRSHGLRRALWQRGGALPLPGRARALDGLQPVRHLRLRVDLRALARRPRRSWLEHHLHPPDPALSRDGEPRAPARADPRLATGGVRRRRCDGRGRPRHTVALSAARRAVHDAGLSRAALPAALRGHAGAGRHGQGLCLDGGVAGAALHPAAHAASSGDGRGALRRPAGGGDERSRRGDRRHLGSGRDSNATAQPPARRRRHRGRAPLCL